jgi:putative hemin transport protein
VLERVGTYRNFTHFGHASQVVGDEIDLRLFLHRFHVGFTVVEAGTRGEHRSIQYFDAAGAAVHKIHLRKESDAEAWAAFGARFAAADQAPGQPFTAAPAPAPLRPDSELDVEGFRAAYSRMRDTHELIGLLRTFGIGRLQALRLLAPEFAYPVSPLALRALLHEAAAAALPIMIFVGNQAAIQIYSGPVRTLKQHGDWWNVLDLGFNLHLFEPGIVSAWVVQKPTTDGPVSSLELYGAGQEPLLLAFSKRHPGQEESSQWRAMLASLPLADGAA